MKKSQKPKAMPKGPRPRIHDSKLSSSFRAKPPKVQTTKNGKVISHEEIIDTINGETAYTVRSFPTNPGMIAPWLAQESTGWEQYDYQHLEFRLTSQRGDLNDGKVMAAPDYNVYDAAPADGKAMGTYQNYVQSKITEHMRIPINLASFFSSSKKKFVRSGLASGDLRTYDGCTLFVATEGCSNPGTAALTLSVKYTVRLFVPETEATKLPPPVLDVGNTASQNIPSGIDEPLQVDQVYVNGLSAERSGNTWNIPQGFYTFIANVSTSQTDGLGQNNGHNVQSRMRVFLDGQEVAQSAAGGRIEDSASVGWSQCENTTLGCVNVTSPAGGILSFTNWIQSAVIPPAALTFTMAAGAFRFTLTRQGGRT